MGAEERYVEEPSMQLLESLGWTRVDAFQEVLASGDHQGTLGRDSQSVVILNHRLRAAMRALNAASVPDVIIDEAIAAVTRDRSIMDSVRASREVYNIIRDGYLAEWKDGGGETQTETLRFVDFKNLAANDLLAVQQLWVNGPLHRRRLDIALFINGIPLVLLELKGPRERIQSAFDDNVTDYRDTIPQLFIPNLFVLLSNGTEAKIGSTYAPYKFFSDWAVIDAMGTRGKVALETAIRGACDPAALLDLFENFVAYLEKPGGLIKNVARAHQFYGVNAAIDGLHHQRVNKDKRLGVFWHTQGSGKSLSMLWFTQKVHRTLHGKWTFVMVTDRKELDTQLHSEFADAGAIDAAARVHASSVAHLRELLAAEHRYVFTLIQKFQPAKAAGEKAMPVVTERNDVIVITDEAHRSQYDTLALNMRTALPNASMMGFTGTPLIAGEEQATREVFGPYVSVYNYADAQADGATVPLYYENRIPELQLANEQFSEDLEAILEDAELDAEAEGALAREFATTYTLLTRPERLRTIAKDLVRHFVGRGFQGKAMYVGLDKAAAVRMYDLVQAEWASYLDELRVEHNALPVLERPWLASRIAVMETTDMAVVVSQAQNELKQLDDRGLDIRPHRARMLREGDDLAENFKDPEHPLRLVFVCAMWMTGFDAPSVSTVYLDRPMKNHTLMQTIARANRVFPEKENGLIVDYVGVFRNLEKALSVYGSPRGGGDSPISIVDELAVELEKAIAKVVAIAADLGISLQALKDADGFDHIAQLNAAVETLLGSHERRRDFMSEARQARKLFKALLPNPKAARQQAMIAVIREVYERIADVTRPEFPDYSHVANAVDALLDRSVGAEEYVIRAVADGRESDPLIDLSQINFEGLKAKFGTRQRAETDRLAQLLKQQALGAARRNPTRAELVEKIEHLIADYNAGSVNTDEYLKRLIDLSNSLSEEEERAAREGMTEEQLAIFDLLTQPDPVLTNDERERVKGSAKLLLEQLRDVIVRDWRRKSDIYSGVESTIRRVLDQGLPDPYNREIFATKVDMIYKHILVSYGDDGESPYSSVVDVPVSTALALDYEGPINLHQLADDAVERILRDPEFAEHVAKQLAPEKH